MTDVALRSVEADFAGEPGPSRDQPPHMTLDEVAVVFQRWLYLPDLLALFAILGTVAANLLPGDPVWLLLVGPPGGGKSELLQAVGGLPNIHPAATLTEPALLSATPKREREAGARGGLLRAIGDFGIVVCKDFGSVLSMHRDQRAQVLAALREIYDGSWTRHVGAGGGQVLHWTGKVGLVAGCPPTIDRHHAVIGAMGERFVLMRLPIVDADAQAHRALDHAGHERDMRSQLTAAVNSLFAAELKQPRPPTVAERERLVALATLVVRCRSAVERDGYSREVELIPDPEAPTRLVIVLERLLAGLDAIGSPRERAWDVVNRIALDSMPALRRTVIDTLHAEGEIGTPVVAELVRHPERTVSRTLEDLAGHRITEITKRGEGKKPHTWRLTAWAAERYALVTRPPETSGTARTATERALTPPLLSHLHPEEDISGGHALNGISPQNAGYRGSAA